MWQKEKMLVTCICSFSNIMSSKAKILIDFRIRDCFEKCCAVHLFQTYQRTATGMQTIRKGLHSALPCSWLFRDYLDLHFDTIFEFTKLGTFSVLSDLDIHFLQQPLVTKATIVTGYAAHNSH